MHKKKYGKMTVGAWLNSELDRTNCIAVVILGIVFAICGIIVRIWIGSPYRTILELGIAEVSPPAWLMTIVWTVAFFINGCAAGIVLTYKTGGLDSEKYRGCLYLFLLTLLELLWYPTLFGGQLVFISVLESLLILCLSIIITLFFYRVTKFAGMLFLLHDVWLIYMLIMNIAILFQC